MRRADAIVNVNSDWRVNLPFRPRRLEYIPNIVEETFFATTAAPEPGRVLYCGGPSRRKGWDVLLEAWPLVARARPAARLRASGWTDPEAASERDERPGITRLPILAPSTLAAEMSRASLLVIPARYEVSPIVISEAWAVGTPVVSTTAGGLATFAPGAAKLVPQEDPQSLAAAIVSVLDGDPRTPAAVAEGKCRAQLQSAAAVASSHLALYDDLGAS